MCSLPNHFNHEFMMISWNQPEIAMTVFGVWRPHLRIVSLGNPPPLTKSTFKMKSRSSAQDDDLTTIAKARSDIAQSTYTFGKLSEKGSNSNTHTLLYSGSMVEQASSSLCSTHLRAYHGKYAFYFYLCWRRISREVY